METSNSEKLFAEAQAVMPGGVNSPVRAFKSVGGTPITFKSGQGAYLQDWDGNRYLDFCCSWGPLVLGHAHPFVKEKIERVLADGWTFGTPHRSETLLAQMVLDKLGFADLVRFVNSGTEAVMTAVRLARGVTGRPLIIKFDGCYHGHLDSLLVNAGSGLATFGTASSAGVPEEIAGTTLVLPLDDEAALEAAFRVNGSKIAAVAIETIPANNGLLIQRKNFLRKIRELCSEYGSLMLCDEVLVGLRVTPAFAFQNYGIEPDITTLGKVIGGGFPAAALAGKKDIMEQLAPVGPVYQAGTLSGNPVAMTAGIATLEVLFDKGYWHRLMEVSQLFHNRIEERLRSLSLPVEYVHESSLFWFSLDSHDAPKTADTIEKSGIEKYAHLHKKLLEEGLYFAPSGYEVGFLNTALTDEEIDRSTKIIVNSIEAVYQETGSKR